MGHKIEIKHRYTGAVLYTHETTDERQASGMAMRDALEAACSARANLSNANLSYANLSGAYLSGAYLSNANLSDANLSYAYLSDAYLSDANLSDANLSDAYLSNANLSNANLSDANLSGANLSGANLSDANLSDAYLSGGEAISGARPVFQVGPIGSRCSYFTAYTTTGGIRLRAGCFFGSVDEFRAKLVEEHGDNAHAQEYAAALQLIETHARLWPAASVETEVEAA